MRPLVRPELRAMFRRWRECWVGAAVLALGLWWAFVTGGLLGWLGYALIVAGAALTAAGVQRGRFRAADDGPGVVQVIEGQISYFGPLTGGAVALSELRVLSLDPATRPAHWILVQRGQDNLHIPVTARGADALFDAFARLPGIRTGRMLEELKRGGDHPVVIWQSDAQTRDLRRLH